MNRRDIIALLCGAAAWPVAARAQQGARMRRVGVLLGAEERDPTAKVIISAFRQEFQKLGWAEGQTLRIEVRFAAADPNRMRSYAAELVGLAPDVMLSNTPAATRALQQATKTIPIVFTGVGDPVVAGIVANTARPEGNATGFTNFLPSFGGKWLELLTEAVPRVARTALVFNPEVSTGAYFAPIEAAAAAMAAKLVRTPYRNGSELESAIDSFAAEPNGAMLVLPPNPTGTSQELILRLAAKHKLPAIYSSRVLVARGGLMSYDPDGVELNRRAASYVDQLLRGAKISDLPVQFPTKYDLTINIKAAKALGLEIPPSLLIAADEVIE